MIPALETGTLRKACYDLRRCTSGAHGRVRSAISPAAVRQPNFCGPFGHRTAFGPEPRLPKIDDGILI
jgi:hypothetical protein